MRVGEPGHPRVREHGPVGTEVRRAADRFTTGDDGRTTRHSFSFAQHYDPANVRLGVLLAHNDDLLLPGAGYASHPHSEVEIVTWVVTGRLRHEDALGNVEESTAGTLQRVTAGTGIRHSERNASDDEPVRFVQTWLQPHRPGLPPSYESADLADRLRPGELVPVGSGLSDVEAPGRLHAAAALHVGRLGAGDMVRLPVGPYLHVFVATGTAELEGAGALDEGDAARLTEEPPRRLRAVTATQVLVWQLAES